MPHFAAFYLGLHCSQDKILLQRQYTIVTLTYDPSVHIMNHVDFLCVALWKNFIDLRRVESIHLLVKFSFGALISLLKHSGYEAKVRRGVSFYMPRYGVACCKPYIGNSRYDTKAQEGIFRYMPRYDVSIYSSFLGIVEVPVL